MTNRRSRNEQPEQDASDNAPDETQVLDDAQSDPGNAVVVRTSAEIMAAVASRPGPLAAVANPDLMIALRENMGIDQLGVRDLPTIRIPAGGAQFWTVPTAEGPTPQKEVEGVVIHQRTMRAMWRTSYDENPGTPPACSSADGITGRGDNGVPEGAVSYNADGGEVYSGPHECGTCPLNQFGSAQSGTNAKQCREQRVLFMLREGEGLPTAVVLSPMSIDPVKKHMARMTSAGLPYYHGVTRLGLEQAKNGKGLDYSRATVALARRLDDEEKYVQAAYRQEIMPMLDAVSVESVLVNADPEAGS